MLGLRGLFVRLFSFRPNHHDIEIMESELFSDKFFLSHCGTVEYRHDFIRDDFEFDCHSG